MDQCPHCGSSVIDGPKCPNCGQSLDALPDYQSEADRYGTGSPARPDDLPATERPDEEAHQSDPDGPTQEADSPDDADTADGPLGGKISRRALLGGAGASVALLGVGGAGWMYLRGGGGGNGVVRSYVDAIAADNWAQAEELYHEDAPIISRIEETQGVEDYEGYLDSREILEQWEDLDPELDGIQEFYRATEISEESIDALRIQIGGDTIERIDEARTVIAFLTVEVGALNEDREEAGEYYENGTQNRPLTCELVLADGEWSLWNVRGVGLFG